VPVCFHGREVGKITCLFYSLLTTTVTKLVPGWCHTKRCMGVGVFLHFVGMCWCSLVGLDWVQQTLDKVRDIRQNLLIA